MRYLILCALLMLAAGCAQGDIEGEPNDGASTTGGGPADCIEGVTCPADCTDNDGDGFGPGCALGFDCDDNDAQRAPNASETCDGKDNDCNGAIDDALICGSQPANNTNNSATCTDNDQDGYGVGCASGSDCDDADPERFEGAPEACDGKDNDCDNSVDEGFDLGMSCTAGLGLCAANGTVACAADGTMGDCSATAGSPSTEVCDRADNDCDGMTDEGLNCPACIEDSNEPDDSSLNGTSLNAGGSISGQLCPSNIDWFQLGSFTAGQSVSVTALFSHAQGNINMEVYVGSTFETGSYSTTDNEILNHTLTKSGNVAVRLYYPAAPGAAGNSYTIQR